MKHLFIFLFLLNVGIAAWCENAGNVDGAIISGAFALLWLVVGLSIEAVERTSIF